jgi:hypothetical protein
VRDKRGAKVGPSPSVAPLLSSFARHSRQASQVFATSRCRDLATPHCACYNEPRGAVLLGNRMRFRILVATWAAASISLSAVATPALANGIVFDGLNGVASSAAFAGGTESVISGSFKTKAAPVHVNVALLLRDRFRT